MPTYGPLEYRGLARELLAARRPATFVVVINYANDPPARHRDRLFTGHTCANRVEFMQPIEAPAPDALHTLAARLSGRRFMTLTGAGCSTESGIPDYRNPETQEYAPTDAEIALELLLRHPEKVPPLRRQSPAMRALQRVVEDRRALVEDRVRLTNRLTSALKARWSGHDSDPPCEI